MSLINRNSKIFNQKKKAKKERNAQRLIPLSTIENAIVLYHVYLALVYLEIGKRTKQKFCFVLQNSLYLTLFFSFQRGLIFFCHFSSPVRTHKKGYCILSDVGGGVDVSKM